MTRGLRKKPGYIVPSYKKAPPLTQEEPDRPAWRYHPEQSVRPPIPEDEPYFHYTPEAQEYYTEGIIEKMWKDGSWNEPPTQVDPAAEPFCQVYEGVKGDQFSPATVVSDPDVWYWVQRVLPKEEQTVRLLTTADVGSDPLPSGWKAPAAVKPPLPYFVRRTRNNLLPVYKQVEVREKYRDFKRIKWRTILEYVPERQPETYTEIRYIDGDIRKLEQEIRSFLEQKCGRKILTAVREPQGQIYLKQDHVVDIVNWLQEKGF